MQTAAISTAEWRAKAAPVTAMEPSTSIQPRSRTGVNTAPLTLRGFQQEIVELARERNVVMVGETGIGKTFVAIALLSEQDYGNGKRAFFMAPTRQLVWQITAKIRACSTLRANAYCGRAMEQWGAHEWNRELLMTRVFVCTPEVLRNALERGFVGMQQINLLVFDECHHVTKRHPYAHVIKLYDPKLPHVMPRVFGTTACPTKDCAKNLYAMLHKVELQTHETVAYAAAAPIQFETYDKEDEDHDATATTTTTSSSSSTTSSSSSRVTGTRSIPTTSASKQTVNVQDASEDARGEDDDDDESVPLQHNELENWMRREFQDSVYATLLDKLVETKAVPVLDKLLSKGRSDAARDDTRRAKLLRKFILTCVEMYRNWGLWCVYRYIELEIERAAINASLLLLVPGSMFGFDSAAITTIMLARRRRDECAFAASKRLIKVAALLSQHTEDGAVEDGDESVASGDLDDETETVASTASTTERRTRSLQGIIFVTTRAECRVLCEYLNEKMGHKEGHADSDDSEEEEEDVDDSPIHSSFAATEAESPKDPRFACVLGQAASRDTASFNLPKMEETLTKFEQGSIQFLVSTAVSIEGVDFPQCALIIVAARIPAARKLIQLRGRARHEDGVVYYLAEEGDVDHSTHFRIMMTEAEAINALDFRHDKQETILQQPRTQAAKKLAGFDFFPGESKITIPSTGAVLDLDSSVSRLNMFCQTLPPQLYTIDYKTMYTFIQEEVMRRPMFRAKLQLPVELEIPPFVTERLHSKATAKAAAAFQGCKYLLEKGLLDESLNSVYRKGKAAATLDVDNLSYFLNRLHHQR